MNTVPIKDYVDARDDAITAGVQQYFANTDARLAEMETRLVRGQAEMIKWCVGVIFAGMTINISVSAYLYSATAGRLDEVVHRVELLQQQVSATQQQVSATQQQVSATQQQVHALQQQVTATQQQVAATQQQVQLLGQKVDGLAQKLDTLSHEVRAKRNAPAG